MKLICLPLFMLFTMTFSLQAVEDTYQFDSEQQRQVFKQLTAELRCPKCQNQNIADSNALISNDMRDKVLELLKQGYNREQVINYMVDRYGYFVHYAPPQTAATSILWIAPISVIIAGFIGIFVMSRRKVSALVDSTEADKLLDQKLSEKDHQS